MSRRSKHLLQELERDLPPLGEEHEVVKVVAPRGGSIVDVERADGTRSLCLMPKKFNRTLWVKRDGFLLIERADGIPPLQASAPSDGIPRLQTTVHAQPGPQSHHPTSSSKTQHASSSSATGAQGEASSSYAQPDLKSQQGVHRNGQPENSSNFVSPLPQSHLAPHQPHLSPSQPHPAPSQPHPPPSQSHATPSPSAASEVTSGHTQQASEQPSTHPTAAESREHLHDNGNHQPAAEKGPLTPPDAPKQAVVPGHAAKAAVRTAGGAAIRSSQPAAQGSSKIMGTILAVLYDEQIKQLKKTPGAWPPEFGHKGLSMPTNQVPGEDNPPERHSSSDDDSEDGLPPLEKNMNRRIIVHDDSDEDEDESDDER